MSFLFSSGVLLPPIPDNALLHYPLLQRSNSTIQEELENADGTANGSTNISNTWWQGNAEEGDGVDDYLDLTDWSVVNWGADLDTDSCLLFTFEILSTDTGVLGGVTEDPGPQEYQFGPTGFFDTGGVFEWNIQDRDGNNAAVSSSTDVTDGTRYRCALNKTGQAASDLEIWLNATEEASVTQSATLGSNVTNFTNSIGFLARIRDTGAADYINARVDNIIACGGALTAQEIQDDYDNQPWS